MDVNAPLHGKLSQETQCRDCHGEHNGPHAALTNLDRFDHNCAAFALTGKHQRLDCQACHANSIFKGTAQACVSCHAEPKVHQGRFGTACAQCHSTATWKEALLAAGSFNHDRTAFKLTGKHQSVACNLCHINNVFKGTAQDCVSCHAEPKVHKAKYGTACAQCHSTTTWKRSTFQHTFPINHGQGRGKWKDTALLTGTNTCTACHKAAPDFKSYTCYGCHAHSPDRVARQHSRQQIANLDRCTKCHRTGRSHEHRRAEAEVHQLQLCQRCSGLDKVEGGAGFP
jgi:hypothetical protein